MAEARDYSDGRGVRAGAAIATLVAAVILAFVIAYWTWQILAPRPVRVPLPAVANPAQTLIASGLFGSAANPVATDAAEPAAVGGNVRLLGIAAGEGGQGYAIFGIGPATKVVATGETITEGAVLDAVRPDSVTVHDGAGTRRLSLWPPVTGQSGEVRASTASTGGVRRTVASCAPPAGFSGPVIRLNSELLGGLASEGRSWNTLLAGSRDGLVVRESGGYAAMLGLAAGDRIEQANGIALRSPDDIASAVLRPLTQDQGVRLRGTHGGEAREIWIASASCAG